LYKNLTGKVLKTPDEFQLLVNELRGDKKLKNDDTSLIIIDITKAPDKPITTPRKNP
jgi:hypothetical protein